MGNLFIIMGRMNCGILWASRNNFQIMHYDEKHHQVHMFFLLSHANFLKIG